MVHQNGKSIGFWLVFPKVRREVSLKPTGSRYSLLWPDRGVRGMESAAPVRSPELSRSPLILAAPPEIKRKIGISGSLMCELSTVRELALLEVALVSLKNKSKIRSNVNGGGRERPPYTGGRVDNSPYMICPPSRTLCASATSTLGFSTIITIATRSLIAFWGCRMGSW